MIKRYYNIIKKYFKLGANNKKCLLFLSSSAFFRSIALLLIPFVASKIIDAVTIKDYMLAYKDVGLFLICSLVYVFFHHCNYVAYCKNSVYTHNKLQKLILDKVTYYDEDFSKHIKSSFIVNTAFKDVGKAMQVPDQLFDFICYIISIIISLVILISVNIYMGIITFILLILYFISLNKNLRLRDFYLDKERKYNDSISELIGEVLDGNVEVKSFDMKNDLNKYLEENKKKWRKNFFPKRKYYDKAEVISPMILAIAKIIVYFIAINLILKGQYSIGTLVLVIGYFEGIEDRIYYFFEKIDAISEESISVNRIHILLNYKNKNMMNFGDIDLDDIEGKIEFNNVSFIYEKQEILKNVSFKLKPNSFTAIVGKSGSGKSTIFRLLLRLYKCNRGSILLDDINIYDYKKEVYSSNVSIVTQKPFIFDMSIRDNLNLVDSNKKNQEEACKRAGVHDYIMSLPDGYNTKLVSDASNISNGEKQLIALARTLLSKSEVLLFDEVTSSLDLSTSKKVMKILKDLKKDHTILMITHKPALMKLADEIIVIDNGKLVGKGKHKDLIKRNKYYQTLQK